MRPLMQRLRSWWHLASGAAVDEARDNFHQSTLELRRSTEALDKTTTRVWLDDPRRREDADLIQALRKLGTCVPAAPKERKEGGGR